MTEDFVALDLEFSGLFLESWHVFSIKKRRLDLFLFLQVGFKDSCCFCSALLVVSFASDFAVAFRGVRWLLKVFE